MHSLRDAEFILLVPISKSFIIRKLLETSFAYFSKLM